jgi:hypothetical protein
MCSKYSTQMYGNREGMRGSDGEHVMIRVHCVHVWKHHNETTNMLTKKLKLKKVIMQCDFETVLCFKWSSFAEEFFKIA